MPDAVGALTGTETITTDATQNGTSGGTLPEWLAAAPDDLKGEKSLHSFKDPMALAKSFVETKRLVGNSVRLPGPEAKPEEWDAIHERLGWPKDPKGYTYTKPEVPASHAFTDEELQTAITSAHDLRLTPRQFQAILDREAEERRGAAKAAEAAGKTLAEARAKTLGALQAKYGAAWAEKLGAAQRVLKDAPAEIVQWFEGVSGPAQQYLLELAIAGGEARAEDTLARVDVAAGVSAEDAKAKAAAILNDPKSAYWDPNHVGHKDAVAEVTRLYGVIHGTKPANLSGTIT